MTTNATIEDEVRAELDLDPRIPDPSEIAVSADDYGVTLRGTVGSFGQRRAAVNDARKFSGADDVTDEIKVRLLEGSHREDDEIRGISLQILMWDADLPSESIDVKVSDGWITLKGDVPYQYQSDFAYEDVAGLFGVVGVTNEIRVDTP